MSAPKTTPRSRGLVKTMTPENIERWKERQRAISEDKKRLTDQLGALNTEMLEEDTRLVETFMTYYKALPRQVRMKIRQAVNMHTEQKGSST